MTSHKRRRLLQMLAASGAAGLAGCSGQDDSGSGSDESSGDETDEESGGGQEYSWPPARNVVEMAIDTDVGGLQDVLVRLWLPYFEQYVQGDVNGAVSNETGAQGVIMANRVANDALPDGGTMGVARVLSSVTNQIGAPDANYDVRDLRGVVRFSADTRAIQMNPRTTPVEDHYDITWEGFQDFVVNKDEPLNWPLSNAAQVILGQVLFSNDPVINIDEHINFINVGGGSEARAAMQRGDADCYFGSFISNSTSRNDFYYTQFCIADPEKDPAFWNDISTVPPEFSPEFGDRPEEKVVGNFTDQAAIVNTAYPREAADKIVGLVADHSVAYLPPDTPDDIYQIHADAWQQCGEDEDLAADVSDQYAAADHNPLAGEAVSDLFNDKYELIANDDQISTLVEEELY